MLLGRPARPWSITALTGDTQTTRLLRGICDLPWVLGCHPRPHTATLEAAGPPKTVYPAAGKAVPCPLVPAPRSAESQPPKLRTENDFSVF